MTGLRIPSKNTGPLCPILPIFVSNALKHSNLAWFFVKEQLYRKLCHTDNAKMVLFATKNASRSFKGAPLYELVLRSDNAGVRGNVEPCEPRTNSTRLSGGALSSVAQATLSENRLS